MFLASPNARIKAAEESTIKNIWLLLPAHAWGSHRLVARNALRVYVGHIKGNEYVCPSHQDNAFIRLVARCHKTLAYGTQPKMS